MASGTSAKQPKFVQKMVVDVSCPKCPKHEWDDEYPFLVNVEVHDSVVKQVTLTCYECGHEMKLVKS